MAVLQTAQSLVLVYLFLFQQQIKVIEARYNTRYIQSPGVIALILKEGTNSSETVRTALHKYES